MEKQLNHNQLKQKLKRLSAQKVLVYLGVPRESVFKVVMNGKGNFISYANANPTLFKRRPNFWERDQYELKDLLKLARKCYLEKVKKYHPDLPGGGHDEMCVLNDAWSFLEDMFRRKGYTLD